MREDVDIYRSVVILLIINEKNDFLHLMCAVIFSPFDFDFGSASELVLLFRCWRS